MSQVSAFEVANSSWNNITLGILKIVWSRDTVPSLSLLQLPLVATDRERTTREVQELNSPNFFKTVTGSFLKTLFQEINHLYHPLDEDIFRDDLKSWDSSSFSTPEKAPLELLQDVKFFPVLLFQYLALTFQFSSPEYDTVLDSLRFTAHMSFDGVASDYSQSDIHSWLYEQAACHFDCRLGANPTHVIL